jgi:DNA-directed RNA polymerase subunit RPC12/RpoP
VRFLREALHVIDKETFILPYSATIEEVTNFKKLAEKDLFQCPYCSAKLIVKSGEERGLYFSHLHSEACVESKAFDKAEKRYKKQTERETKIHKVLMNIVFDELSTQSKNNPKIAVDYGYKAKSHLKDYPDIWVKINDKEYALSIVTNIKSTMDSKLAEQITKRHQYFLGHRMEPIWFIEKKEQSIEKEKNAIILWDAEISISSKTNEDRKWELLLDGMIKDRNFFNYFNYPVSKAIPLIDVRSMYYIYSNEEKIVVKIQRFLKDRDLRPYRSFLLNEGYEISFADALVIKTDFLLSNPEIEELYRNDFRERFLKLQKEYRERQRKEAEKKQLEEDQRQKEHEEVMERIRQSRVLIPEPLPTPITSKKMTFNRLMTLHQTTLKGVRDVEHTLSRGMKNDWERVQKMVRKCKNGEEFDYDSFKVNLQMICYACKVQYQ